MIYFLNCAKILNRILSFKQKVFFVLIISIIILFLLLIIALIISFVCYRITFCISSKQNRDPHILLEGVQYEQMKDKILPLVDSALKIPYEDVNITSFDGKKLHGAYYEVNKGAPVQIMFHGYKSIAIRDYCGALQFTLKAGYNVLLVDQRAHGISEGKCLTFGILERKDCVSWVNYVSKRFGFSTKIILVGVSMGAATVLMASELELPQNVVGIIADSSYSSPESIIKKVIGDMHLPVLPSYFFVYLGARIFGGFDLNKSSAENAVKKCKVPILFFHGEADTFVPCEMCYEIYNKCSAQKNMITVSGADHGLEYLVDKEKYMSSLNEFLKKIS